jgi:hypothetical protein
MRRELSWVGVSLLVYACALVLGSLVICENLRARPILGLSLLEDFQRVVNEQSNPENGRT